MKAKGTSFVLLFGMAIAVSLTALSNSTLAQTGAIDPGSGSVTNSKIIYHLGPVMSGTSNVYLIWYGNWGSATPGNSVETQNILSELVLGLGSSPYARINTLYQDSLGSTPGGILFFGGSVNDNSYSQGSTLTPAKIQAIINQHIIDGHLPLDASGIFLVLGSSDITDLRPDSTTFCTASTPPHHGVSPLGGTQVKYAFIGNAARCPLSAAPQFIAADGSTLPTPNGNLAADGMSATIAHALNTVITNPLSTAWFDKYGLENADKCQGTFGQTYVTTNGARANMQLGNRHFLIQQNWVNVGKGYCGLTRP